MVREVAVDTITDAVCDMCIRSNHFLSPDMEKALKEAAERETRPLAVQVLEQLKENLKIAGEEMIPICQDTGMAVVFMDIGQDVHFVGGDLTEAVHEGVRQGYQKGYLRKSVVGDPILRCGRQCHTYMGLSYGSGRRGYLNPCLKNILRSGNNDKASW